LVAYYVPEPQREVTAADLRAFLEAKLPEYAVPTAFVPIDAVPLMPSGKIDRNALPQSASEPVSPNPATVSPRTHIEETLAKIWCDVLNLSVVGVHDNFFELGGHSLKITQVISRVRQAFNVELPFAQVFQDPTIARLASQIEERCGKDPITATSERRKIKRRTASSGQSIVMPRQSSR
jgi:acyl carrier protein